MSDMFSVTDLEKIDELQKELKYRRHVYPRLIAKGKMTIATSDRRTRVLKAILQDYEKKASPDAAGPEISP